jgi:hypothetical protein
MVIVLSIGTIRGNNHCAEYPDMYFILLMCSPVVLETAVRVA